MRRPDTPRPPGTEGSSPPDSRSPGGRPDTDVPFYLREVTIVKAVLAPMEGSAPTRLRLDGCNGGAGRFGMPSQNPPIIGKTCGQRESGRLCMECQGGALAYPEGSNMERKPRESDPLSEEEWS